MAGVRCRFALAQRAEGDDARIRGDLRRRCSVDVAQPRWTERGHSLTGQDPLHRDTPAASADREARAAPVCLADLLLAEKPVLDHDVGVDVEIADAVLRRHLDPEALGVGADIGARQRSQDVHADGHALQSFDQAPSILHGVPVFVGQTEDEREPRADVREQAHLVDLEHAVRVVSSTEPPEHLVAAGLDPEEHVGATSRAHSVQELGRDRLDSAGARPGQPEVGAADLRAELQHLLGRHRERVVSERDRVTRVVLADVRELREHALVASAPVHAAAPERSHGAVWAVVGAAAGTEDRQHVVLDAGQQVSRRQRVSVQILDVAALLRSHDLGAVAVDDALDRSPITSALYVLDEIDERRLTLRPDDAIDLFPNHEVVRDEHRGVTAEHGDRPREPGLDGAADLERRVVRAGHHQPEAHDIRLVLLEQHDRVLHGQPLVEGVDDAHVVGVLDDRREVLEPQGLVEALDVAALDGGSDERDLHVASLLRARSTSENSNELLTSSQYPAW